MKGLVLAGGYGTRLRPLTFTGNKHMIPVANQPILFYGLKQLAQAGIRDVAIVLGPLHETIQETVGDGSALGLRVSYIHQGDPLGLAHAVLCAREFLAEEPFVMYLGDNLLQEGLGRIVDLYQRSRPSAVVGVTPVSQPSHYGIIELNGDTIVSIEEKPSHPRGNLALIGVYLFGPEIHPVIAELKPSRRGELEITEAIWKLVQGGHRVVPHPVRGWWKDTGRPEDLLEANELVLSTMAPEAFVHHGTVSREASLSGPVGIGLGTVVENDVEIVGPVVIGAGARIGAGTRIGPSTALGDGVVVHGAGIRRSIVLEGSHIQGAVQIADSLIGRNVTIRSGATTPQPLRVTLGDAAQVDL